MPTECSAKTFDFARVVATGQRTLIAVARQRPRLPCGQRLPALCLSTPGCDAAVSLL
jgi:hypothetical protein